jgi:hypothetical protein
MPEIVLTMRLTNEDWDDAMRGWRCPVLSIPGAIVEAVYVEGSRVDTGRYEVLTPNTFVRWITPDRPQRVALSIKLTEALSLDSETERWKRLAIVLPVVATIVAASISGAATYLSRSPGSSAAYRTSDVQNATVVQPTKSAPTQTHGTASSQDEPPVDTINSGNTSLSNALPIDFGVTYRSRFSGDDSSRYFWISQENGKHDLTIEFSLVSPDPQVRPTISIYDKNQTKMFSWHRENEDDRIVKLTAPITPGDYVMELRPSASSGKFAEFLLSVGAR